METINRQQQLLGGGERKKEHNISQVNLPPAEVEEESVAVFRRRDIVGVFIH